ncbi:MAG TPA: 5'/3'-nucleotidase SurE [Syntrophorhabdaceae bacterium]|nr:5'/3'-nucleotidase SurE [Syntrophorhabdaceae bacterium]
MLILLTNDDGIHSEGIQALKSVLDRQHRVCVVAPERERTCVGHAITLHKPLRLRKVSDNTYASNGSPADCIYLGIKAILKTMPDMIISGINKGPNMGQDVHYSGTVAAAKEGAFLGIPSMAVSICAREHFLFGESAKAVSKIVEILAGKPFIKNTFLNINIPNRPFENIKGLMMTKLGKRIYNDKVIKRKDPRGGSYYWIGGKAEQYENRSGTDFFAVERDYISITPFGLDMTFTGSIEKYKKYFRRSL